MKRGNFVKMEKKLIVCLGAIYFFLGSIEAYASGLLYQLPLTWQDDMGKSVRLQNFIGKPTVLVMSYGACKKICSTSIFRMEQMQTIIDRNKMDVQFVVVGLDPKNDRPEDWRQFRQDRKLTRINWYFLSGSPNDIKSLAGNLGINYWIYHDHVVHDFVITLLDADGNILQKMVNGGESLDRFLSPAIIGK